VFKHEFTFIEVLAVLFEPTGTQIPPKPWLPDREKTDECISVLGDIGIFFFEIEGFFHFLLQCYLRIKPTKEI